MHDTQPISLVGTTPANDSVEEVHEFEHDGVITNAQVGTHVGQEYALENHAEVIRDGSRSNLWEALDHEFLAGNGRDYDLSLRFEFTEGDKLILRTVNSDPDHSYHHSMIIGVDYETSISHRVKDALRGTL